MKNHMKARSAPNTWNIRRKEEKFVARPNSGGQALEMTLPLGMLLRNLKVADTKKEINYVIKNTPVLVNARRRWDYNFGVGFLDVLSLPETKQSYVLTLDKKGRLVAEHTEETGSKLSQARGVSKIRGNRLQLHLSDGRNIIVDKPVAAGTTVVVSVPESKVLKLLPVEAKSTVILTAGKHRGKRGVIESMTAGTITVQTDEGTISTKKSYAFVLGGAA